MDLTQLPCGYLVLNHKNIIVEVNSLFCLWLGYSEHQVLQQPFTSFLVPASRIVYLGHMLPKLQTLGTVEEKYLLLKTASGAELPVMVNAQKFPQQADDIFVFSFMKMLRRHLIEEQLVHARRGAEQANAEKDALNLQLQITQAELMEKQQQLLRLNQELESLAVTDSLTGVYNRRFYDKELNAQLAGFQRSGQKFALVLLDIDFFKTVNDTHGHEMGDKVLIAVASQLQQGLREIDTLARIGGEEFALILPYCDSDEALVVAERYRGVIENSQHIPVSVTASFGVTEALAQDSTTSLYKRADKALYLSKTNGRNRVTALVS